MLCGDWYYIDWVVYNWNASAKSTGPHQLWPVVWKKDSKQRFLGMHIVLLDTVKEWWVGKDTVSNSSALCSKKLKNWILGCGNEGSKDKWCCWAHVSTVTILWSSPMLSIIAAVDLKSTQSVFVHSMLLTAVTDFHKGESPREGKRWWLRWMAYSNCQEHVGRGGLGMENDHSFTLIFFEKFMRTGFPLHPN